MCSRFGKGQEGAEDAGEALGGDLSEKLEYLLGRKKELPQSSMEELGCKELRVQLLHLRR